MDIRPFRDADRDAVIALWRAAFPNEPARNDPGRDIERKQAVQPELFLVAAVEGAVVGTAMGGYDGHRGWVYLVAVDPHRRRQGIGRALMRAAEERLARLGCAKLNLQVRASNAEVVTFYRRLGYDVEERVSMGKALDANGRQQ
jgi:hypothetical protein